MKRISTRLAVSFLIVALLPTLPLSLVVRDLLERRFGPAIADPLETALESGLAESRAHLQELAASCRCGPLKVAFTGRRGAARRSGPGSARRFPGGGRRQRARTSWPGQGA